MTVEGCRRALPLGLVTATARRCSTSSSAAASPVLAIVGTLVILKICDLTVGLRVSKAQEVEGLDVSMHGEEGIYSIVTGGQSGLLHEENRGDHPAVQTGRSEGSDERHRHRRHDISEVRGHGRQKGIKRCTAGRSTTWTCCPRSSWKWCASSRFEEVLKALSAAARTGKIGDGKIFVYDVAEAIRIRNDDRGESAL